MLLMTTCTLTLTDEEFTGFLTEINQTALKYMDIGVKEGSRQRQITLIPPPPQTGRGAGETRERTNDHGNCIIRRQLHGEIHHRGGAGPVAFRGGFQRKGLSEAGQKRKRGGGPVPEEAARRGDDPLRHFRKGPAGPAAGGLRPGAGDGGLATIKERFAARMHGNLPAPVAAMLERKYGRFETEAHDLRVDTDAVSAEEAANEIRLLLNRGERDAQN